MEKLLFSDKELRQIFCDEDTFSFAQNIEGKVFRKYENRVTKQFEIHDKSYFIKFHGPVGWKEIFKNLIQMKTPVVGAQREYDALNHLSKKAINCPEIKMQFTYWNNTLIKSTGVNCLKMLMPFLYWKKT